MKKKLSLKNKLFCSTLYLSILLTLVFTGVEGFATDQDTAAKKAPVTVESPTNSLVKKQETIDSIPEKNLETLKKVEENGIQNNLVKFLLAMLGVIVSSLAIFGALKLYKAFALKSSNKNSDIDYESSFDTPKTFKEAINLFLNKTEK